MGQGVCGQLAGGFRGTDRPTGIGGRIEGSVSENVQLTPEPVKDFDHAGLIKMAALGDGIDLQSMSLDKVQRWLGPAITFIKTIYGGWSP
jgi:hypothetical protein